eukprot:3637745-Rhodomonas_salina.1
MMRRRKGVMAICQCFSEMHAWCADTLWRGSSAARLSPVGPTQRPETRTWRRSVQPSYLCASSQLPSVDIASEALCTRERCTVPGADPAYVAASRYMRLQHGGTPRYLAAYALAMPDLVLTYAKQAALALVELGGNLTATNDDGFTPAE